MQIKIFLFFISMTCMTSKQAVGSLSLDNILDDLDKHIHKENYRNLGSSDLQIKQAQAHVQDHLEDLKNIVKEAADLSRIPKDKHDTYLTQLLGGQIIELLQKEMGIKEVDAFEIYARLQRIERWNHYQWNIPEDDLENGNAGEVGTPPPPPSQKWLTYAGLGAAGLGFGALIAYIKSRGE